MKSNANFHIHTVHSDGQLTVAEIIKGLKESDVYFFSITDHDSIKAYDEILKLREKYHKDYYTNYDGSVNQLRFNSCQTDPELKYQIDSALHCIPGIELSCIFQDGEIGLDETWMCHILGFDFDLEKMQEALDKIKEDKNCLLHSFVNLLVVDGYQLDITNIEEDGYITNRTVIARELINKGYATTFDECFEKILNTEKYKKFARSSPSIKNGIKLIHDCGGVAIWAHPFGLARGGKKTISEKQVNELFLKMKEYGIDGLECYYQKYKQAQIDFLELLADQNYLIKSVGTDFHSKTNGDQFAFAKDGESYLNFKTIYTANITQAFKESFPNIIMSEFFYAVKNNDLNHVQELIAKGVDVNRYDDWRNKPFATACGYGYFEMVKLLVENGVDLKTYGVEGLLAVQGNAISYKAVSFNYQDRIEITKYLIQKGVETQIAYEQAVDKESLTFADLLLANNEILADHKLLKYRQMLKEKLDPASIIAFIEKENLEINHLSKQENSLLMEAINQEDLALVEYLLKRGAKQGMTRTFEVITAASGSTSAILELLLENGGDPNASYENETRNWDNALTVAARGGHLDNIKVLLKYKAVIDVPNYYGDTALMIAAIYNHTEIIKELLSNGASVTATNRDDDDVLDNALENNNFAAILTILASPYVKISEEKLNKLLANAKQNYEYAAEKYSGSLVDTARIYQLLLEKRKIILQPFEEGFLQLHLKNIEKAITCFQLDESDEAKMMLKLLVDPENETMIYEDTYKNIVAWFKIVNLKWNENNEITSVEALKYEYQLGTQDLNLDEGQLIEVGSDFFPNKSLLCVEEWFCERDDGSRFFNVYQTWNDFWAEPGSVVRIDNSAYMDFENTRRVNFDASREPRHQFFRMLYLCECAEDGNARAQFVLANKFYDGDYFFNQDINEAISFFKKSAVLGFKPALDKLMTII